MMTQTPDCRFVLCNSLLSATIQWSSPICEARVTAGSQGPELRSRNGEGAPSSVRAARCAILTPDF
jgi:hypothetical protein